jgi:UDP-galactopyranose mutase
MSRVVVLGAGPAGIGAGIALGERALVLERATDPGGLCATVSLGGTLFDLGGHSFHTPHPRVRDLVFGALPMEEQAREAWCYVRDQWIPYPFQANFSKHGDAALVAECRAGFDVACATALPAANLAEHLEHRYGSGIARHFLRPYNEKLWGGDLRRMSAEWTSERMVATIPPALRVGSGKGVRTPLDARQRIAYPMWGGYGEIFRALARRLADLRFGQAIAAIDPGAKTVTTAKGERIAWERLVVTLPLPALLEILPGVPPELRAAAGRLEALPLALVMIALDSRLETDVQRVYCAEDSMPGHKVVLNNNSSSSLRAMPRHGVLVEVSGAGAAAREDDTRLVERIVAELRRMKVLRPGHAVTGAAVTRVAHGYPVPTHERAAIVAKARAWLAPQGIHIAGRFGEWDYINSDEALHRGLALGESL